MPLKLNCPRCESAVPVTEARRATAVDCPYCGGAFTAFEELGTPQQTTKPRTMARRRNDDDDNDDDDGEGGRTKSRRGHTRGSSVMVLLVGGLGLLFVMSALGGTIYLMITDEPEAAGTKSSDKTRNNLGGTVNPSQGQPPGGIPGTPGRAGPGPGVFGPGLGQPPGGIPPTGQTGFDLRPATGSKVEIRQPPGLDPRRSRVVMFPGKVGQLAVGGGGRYLVLHFPEQGQLCVFDANAAQITASVAADRGEVLVAAGVNLAVLVSRHAQNFNRIIRVYALPQLSKVYDSSVKGFHTAAAAAMGSATNGPVLISDPFGELILYDPVTRETIEGASKLIELGGHVQHIRAAADGRLFVVSTYSGPVILTERNRQWATTRVAGLSGPALVTADGKTAFADATVINTDDGRASGQKLSAGPGLGAWIVPSVSRNYFVRLAQQKDATGRPYMDVSIYQDRDASRPVALIGELPEAQNLGLWGPATPLDQQIFLIPEAGMLAVIPEQKDRIVMYGVNLR